MARDQYSDDINPYDLSHVAKVRRSQAMVVHDMGVAGTYILEVELAKVTEQRDALLAACEAECCPDDLEYAAMVLELSDPGGTLPGQLRRKAALERAAIAKARGEVPNGA